MSKNLSLVASAEPQSETYEQAAENNVQGADLLLSLRKGTNRLILPFVVSVGTLKTADKDTSYDVRNNATKETYKHC
jgi:hypothetical protein